MDPGAALVGLFGTLAVLVVATWLAAVLDGLGRALAVHQPVGLAALAAAPLARLGRLVRRADVIPANADGGLLWSAPVMAVAVVLLLAGVVPLGPGLVIADLNIGLFYVIVLLAPFVVALMNAGWGANAKYGVLGAFRAAGHLLAYEVPFGFAAIGAPMAAESLSLVKIVEGQDRLWYGVWQPVGFAIYLVSAAIITYRPPFDLPAADDLGGGVLADVSGPRYLLLRGSMLALWVLVSALGAVLFLGGWLGPLLPGPVWLVLKTAALMLAMSWVGYRLPRLRVDQMLGLSWKVLLPGTFLHIAITGVVILLQTGG
ncbi:MAG: NADH-quinone oxidoreductase subunit H [Chloroflexi bacterium]|nr:NADH-quinone oxidoreductase subunit H [Chloroflexota bacterium]